MRHQGRRPTQTSGDVSGQLAALNAQRSALNEQLVSLTVRRDLLTQQLRNADDAGKAQLQRQITDVGNRTTSVNAQLNRIDDAVNRLLTQADVAAPAIPAIPAVPAIPPIPEIYVGRPPMFPGQFRGNVGEVVAGAMFAEGLAFALVIFLMWRWMRRRPAPVKLASEETGRLEQLQRSVDVMAVEMERISESQRFVAKLLTERPSLGAGAAQEVAVPARDADEARAKRA